MNREEAIKVLSSYDVNGVWADVDGKPYNAEEQAEAFYMAIEALKNQDRPKGHWKMYGIDDFKGRYTGDRTIICDRCLIRGIVRFGQRGKWNFCPNCGADMRGEDE